MTGTRKLLICLSLSLSITGLIGLATNLDNPETTVVQRSSSTEAFASPTAAPLFLAPPATTTTVAALPPSVPVARHVRSSSATTPAVYRAASLAPVKSTNSTGRDWDYVADCESGQRDKNGNIIRGTANWSANSGNSYYGGLQFSSSTWRQAGGTRYAPLAYQASREQQIQIANEWLDRTSWHQWPICGKYL